MTYGGTPWEYINEKNRANQLESQNFNIQYKYDTLKKITLKILKNETLSKKDKKFLTDEGVLKNAK